MILNEFFTYPQCNKYKLIIQKLYNRQANQKSNSAAWFQGVCSQLICWGRLLIQLVPFGDLATRRIADLVPMIQSGAARVGTSQFQASNNLRNNRNLLLLIYDVILRQCQGLPHSWSRDPSQVASAPARHPPNWRQSPAIVCSVWSVTYTRVRLRDLHAVVFP